MAPTSAIYLCLGIAKIFFLGTRNNQDRISYISTWRKILISHFFFFFEKKEKTWLEWMEGSECMHTFLCGCLGSNVLHSPEKVKTMLQTREGGRWNCEDWKWWQPLHWMENGSICTVTIISLMAPCHPLEWRRRNYMPHRERSGSPIQT